RRSTSSCTRRSSLIHVLLSWSRPIPGAVASRTLSLQLVVPREMNLRARLLAEARSDATLPVRTASTSGTPARRDEIAKVSDKESAMLHFTTSDCVRLAYVIDDFTDPWRRPDTLVLLHAAMGSSRRLYAWVPRLARDFRVVRLDLRGHAPSEVPAAPLPLTLAR